MDVATFVHDLLRYAAHHGFFQRIGLQVEGPIAQGHGYIDDDIVRLYFNETTGTIAFALIRQGERVWGVDRDNVRGWHLHPVEAPSRHLSIEAQTVESILDLLVIAVDALAITEAPKEDTASH